MVHIPQRITIPPGFKKISGSCQLDIDIDGRPGYDFASYEEFADVVGDVVVECLGGSDGEKYVGGREQIGANNWLRVWVTGRWDLPEGVGNGVGGNGTGEGGGGVVVDVTGGGVNVTREGVNVTREWVDVTEEGVDVTRRRRG